MSASRKRGAWRAILALLTLAVATLVFSAGQLAYSQLVMPKVAPHTGDGKFQNLSWRYPWKHLGIAIAGYTIEFDHFDVGKAQRKDYRVENLPSIDKDCGDLSVHHRPKA